MADRICSQGKPRNFEAILGLCWSFWSTLKHLSNHTNFITNSFKRFSSSNSTDPRQRVPLTWGGGEDSTEGAISSGLYAVRQMIWWHNLRGTDSPATPAIEPGSPVVWVFTNKHPWHPEHVLIALMRDFWDAGGSRHNSPFLQLWAFAHNAQ